ncbi:MAG TPA: DUF2303 family protein [Candidatus Eisenbacteria bacterium]|nr:DUF2303 family protein [Candidatus Eisenbacteria bacterium]
MDDETPQPSIDLQALFDFAKERTQPEEYTFQDPEGVAPDVVAIVGFNSGGGVEVLPVDFKREAYRKAPLRRKGTIETHTLGSFVNVVNRDKRPDSVIFADVPAMKLTAILDFHGAADSAPRFGEDRVVYGFQISKQLKAWMSAASSLMDQKTFSRLIDDRIGDVGEGPYEEKSIAHEFARRRGIAFASIADLLVFTRTIAAKSSTASTEQIDETTGDVSIQFSKRGDVQTPDGKPVLVPFAFVLTIPVLSGLGATEFNIPVRLRYDIGEKGITWRIELHALDKFTQAAVDESVKTIAKPAPDGCGLPVFMGSPP